jgi:hypothetical protein
VSLSRTVKIALELIEIRDRISALLDTFTPDEQYQMECAMNGIKPDLPKKKRTRSRT